MAGSCKEHTLEHHSCSTHQAEHRSTHMRMYLARLEGDCCRIRLVRAGCSKAVRNRKSSWLYSMAAIRTLSLVGFHPFLPSNVHHSPKVFFLAATRWVARGSCFPPSSSSGPKRSKSRLTPMTVAQGHLSPVDLSSMRLRCSSRASSPSSQPSRPFEQ